MARSTAARLAAYERRYHAVAERVAEVGFIASGSIVHRYTRCGGAGCRCNADPPTPHGPYWQWTAKVDGKTVTRRLTEAEARLYEEWIANDRHLRALIGEMRQVAAKAVELIVEEATDA